MKRTIPKYTDQTKMASAEMQIVIYGVGKMCKRSRILELNLRRALNELHLKAHVETIVDFRQIAESKIQYLPALTVNGKILFQGGVLPVHRLKTKLKAFM